MPGPSALPVDLLCGPFLLARAEELGVRVAAALEDSLALRCRAALLLHPSAAVSHTAAALLRDLPLPACLTEGPVELRVPAGPRAPRLRAVRATAGCARRT